MRIRIKFAKKESVQYLGHLDIMRFFQRVFNRAEVKMEYSVGFNPHQKMSFAQPLGVGILSRGEYLDAEIAEGQDLEEIRQRMNDVCGDGFEVLSVKAVCEGAKKAMAALQYAEYEVDISGLLYESADERKMLKEEAGEEEETLTAPEKGVSRAINDLLCEEHIPFIKVTKSGEKEVDIRPQIIRLLVSGEKIFMTVTAGSDNNLKPDTLLQCIFDKTDIEYIREKVTIVRKDLFADSFIPLEQFQCSE